MRKNSQSQQIHHRWLLALLPIGLFLIGWQVLASIHLINPALFSKPTDVLRELAALHQRELPTHSLLLLHIGASLKRMGIASLIGIVIGVLVGGVMGTSQLIYRFFDPLITLMMPIPGIAMAPLFIVWLGFGNPTIITLGVIATLFPVIYNTAVGVRSIDPQLVRAARIMGTGSVATFFKVYMPWATGYVLMGVKLGLARCWRTIIAVEFIAAANSGLGYMIWDAAEYLRSGVVYGGILLLIILYFAMEQIFLKPLDKLTVEKWGIVQQ